MVDFLVEGRRRFLHSRERLGLPPGTTWPHDQIRNLCFPSIPKFLSSSPYGCFQKWWYPQIIHFNMVFHYKPSILGYPYFWKHPYTSINPTPTTRNFGCMRGVGRLKVGGPMDCPIPGNLGLEIWNIRQYIVQYYKTFWHTYAATLIIIHPDISCIRPFVRQGYAPSPQQYSPAPAPAPAGRFFLNGLYGHIHSNETLF